MQIGDRVYIDLEIPDLEKKNFLRSTDVYLLEIIESAGTSLPAVIMSFKTYDQDIKDAIVENNKVIVKLGENEEHADSFPVTIYAKNKPSSSTGSGGGTGWVVTFGGFINGNVFMFNNENLAYSGNSLMVAKQIIKDSFGKNIKTNISKTNENQVVWRQNNQTACSFLIEVLLHMDIAPSFPLFSFDKFGNFIIKDFNYLCKSTPAFTFVNGKPSKINEIPFYNNFSPDDFRNAYNIYSGYDRITEIVDSNSGTMATAFTDNSPMLAASRVSESSRTGSRVTTNKIQNSNVHKTYNEAFAYNTSKLLALSVLSGSLELKGRYYRVLAPLDLINLNAGDSKDAEALNGLWIIEAISTHVNFSAGSIETSVAISRDNYNYLENHVKEESIFKVAKRWMKAISAAIYDFKVAYAQLIRIMDGTFLTEVMAFMVATKTNMLRSFSVLGVTIDFNSSSKLIQSMILLGNSLMNTLVDMVFPEEIANLLRDFIIVKPSLMNLLSNYIAEYVPYDIRDIISKLFNSLFKVTDSLNSIASDNGITVTTDTITQGGTSVTTETSEVDYTQDSQERISEIVEDFENNTTGLNIPYPIVELNESQSLMSDAELKDYLADATIENLTNLGYITTTDEAEELKEILIGNKPINFDLINQINKNAGNLYSYRFWGTFGSDQEALFAWTYEDNVVYTKTKEIKEKTRLYNSDYTPYMKVEFKVEKDSTDNYIVTYNGNPTERGADLDVISDALLELTSFAIKKSYKDKYRTIPCTKMISAMGNKRLYFACPQTEENLKFYINTKRTDLESFPVDLGYTDSYGNKIIYNVYYTNTGYNSSSVMLEVKKGGMV